MRRLLPIGLSLLLALAPLSAAAASDRSLLVAPGGSQWFEEGPGGDDEGPVSADKLANMYQDPSQAQDDLTIDGFQSGYQRAWQTPDKGPVLYEMVLKFAAGYGAGDWLSSDRDYDQNDSSWMQSYDTSEFGDAYGGYRAYDGGYESLVEFDQGDRLYAVDLEGPKPDEGLVMSLAQQILDRAPSESSDPGVVHTVVIVGLVAATLLVALGVLIVFVVFRWGAGAGRRPARVFSPDGHWWWDGGRWLPTGR